MNYFLRVIEYLNPFSWQAKAPKIIPLELLERLPPGLFQKLVLDYLPPQDWYSLGRSCPYMSNILNDTSSIPIWSIFENEIQTRCKNIKKLDNLTRLLHPLPLQGPESLESMKRRVCISAKAIFFAKLSEDGHSTIITIPAGWTINDTEAMSKSAIAAGIPSARIEYYDNENSEEVTVYSHTLRNILHNNPIREAQTVILSNTIIKGSRLKPTADHKKILKAHGIKEDFPDALTVLTAIVATRVFTEGQEGLYGRSEVGYPFMLMLFGRSTLTMTRTKQMIPLGGYHWNLCIGSEPSRIFVDYDSSFDFGYNRLGVGASASFDELGI